MTTKIRDNAERRRFELEIDGQTVFAEYSLHSDKLVIEYVEAPLSLRGTGATDILMEGIVHAAQTDGLKLLAACGYAADWLHRHQSID